MSGRARLGGRWQRWTALVVASAVVVGGVVVPGVLPALAASVWGDDDAVSIVRLSTDGAGDPVGVRLAWPAPDVPVDGYQIVRDGSIVQNVGPTDLTALDTTVGGLGTRAFRYEIRALSGTTVIDALGPVDASFPLGAPSCTIVWTGAASSAWHLAANWARVGDGGEPGAPTADDIACATTTANWPITVSQPGAAAKSLTTDLLSAQPTLRAVAGGELTIGDRLQVQTLHLAGGDVELGGDSMLYGTGVRPAAIFGGGTLTLDGTLRGQSLTSSDLDGFVLTEPDTTTTLSGGRLEVSQLRFTAVHKRTIVGRDGHESVIGVVRLAGTTAFDAGPGGATLRTQQFDAEGDDADIDVGWLLGRSSEEDDASYRIDGVVRVDDLEDVDAGAGDREWNNAAVVLTGRLEVAEDVDAVFGVELNDAAADLRFAGRPSFAGVRTLESLRVDTGTTVVADGDLTVRQLSVLPGSTLDVRGEIIDPNGDAEDTEGPSSAEVRGGTVRIAAPWRVQRTGRLDLRDAVVEGDVTVDGLINLGGNTEVPDMGATVTGDLEVRPGGVLFATAFGDDPIQHTEGEVGGQLTVDGSLFVALDGALPEDVDVTLIATPGGPLEGDPEEVSISGFEAERFEVDIRPDGVHLVSTGSGPAPAWEDGDTIQVTRVEVGGSGDPLEVALQWPPTTATPDAFAVDRVVDGVATEVGTVDGATLELTDTEPVERADYVVRAVDAGGDATDELAPARVTIPSADLACTILWTHAAAAGAAGRWSDERNWAPVGIAGSASLDAGVRVPTLDDRACVASGRDDEGVIVDVDEPGTVVGSVVTDRSAIGVDRLGDAPGTSFVVVGGATIGRLLVDGGAAVGVGDSLVVDAIAVAGGASVAVGGGIEHQDLDPDSTSGAVIDASSIQSDLWFVPEDAAIEVAGDSTIVGPVELAGALELDATASLEVDALDAIDSSTITIDVASAPTEPRLSIVDAGLAGEIVVDLGQELPDPTDVLLIATATPPTGTPTLTLTGEAAGTRLVARDEGIRLIRSMPSWPADAILQVTSVVVDEDGMPLELALRWPAASSAPDRYRIVRTVGGTPEVIGQVDGATLTFVDDEPVLQATYEVQAGVEYEAGELTLVDGVGERNVHLLGDPTCTLNFTRQPRLGLDDTSWNDPSNWAPIGIAGSASLAAGARVPTAFDDVCIGANELGQGDIVDLTGASGVAASITGPDAFVALDRVDQAVPASLEVGSDVQLARFGALGASTASVGGSIEVISLFVIDPSSAISATGTIELLDGRSGVPSSIRLEDGTVSASEIEVGEESTATISGASRVVGRLTVGGALEIASGSEVLIEELEVQDTAGWTIDVTSLADAPEVEVPFGLVLDGVLTVDLGEELPDPTDLHLVVSPDPQVSFPPVLTGADAGARAQVEDDGIHVYRDTPQWTDDDLLEVAGLVIDDDGTPLQVGLRWPAPSGNPVGFEVLRSAPGGAFVIATLPATARTYIDEDPFSQAVYTVRAIVGRSTVTDALLPARANFPAAASCTVAWTRGADTARWADAGNWAPHGTAPGVTALAGARAPAPNDHACIPGGPRAERIVSVEAPAEVRRLTASPESVVWLEEVLAVDDDAALGTLLVEGATFDGGGDLSAPRVLVEADGEVLVAGVLTHPEPDEEEVQAGRWGALIEDGSIATAAGWTLPAGASADLERADVVGPLVASGVVRFPADADVTLSGEVELTGDASLDLTLGAPGAPPSVVARELVTLDGTLDIQLLQPLPSGADVALVTTEAAGLLDGDFDTVKLTGATAGVTAVVDDASIRVAREAVADECSAVPALDGLAVEGCWQEGPDDTYTAQPDPDDPSTTPMIGDVVLAPEAGTDLVLDLGAVPATLTSTGPVAVGIDVALPARVARWTSTGPIDWTFGAPVALPTDRFFAVGLASAPTLTAIGGRWQATLRLPMPALLGGGIQGVRGTIGADGRMANPSGATGARSIAEVGRSQGLTITYADLNRWDVATTTPGTGVAVSGQFARGLTSPTAGTITLGDLGVGGLGRLPAPTFTFSNANQRWTANLAASGGTGEIRIVEAPGGIVGAGSHLDLPGLELGVRDLPGPIRIAKGAGGTWSLPTIPAASAVLQQLDLNFAGGQLDGATIRLGDAVPGNLTTPVVGSSGGWLPIGGLTVAYDSRTSTWLVDGFLDQPRVQVSGTATIFDGDLTAATLAIPNVDLGALATLDLELGYTAGRTFSLAATLTGDAFAEARQGSGSLTFSSGGAITAGSLRFAELPIGDLLTIDDFDLDWVGSQSRWSVGGTVTAGGPDAAPVDVGGSMTFTGGVLTAASLTVASLPLGPARIDQLAFSLQRTAGSGAREQAFAVSGQVRGPAVTAGAGLEAELEPVTGSARLLDGRIVDLDLTIPHLEIPGVAHLDDVTLGYAQQAAQAELLGIGTVSTAGDGDAPGATGSLRLRLDDGEVQEAVLSTSSLPIGGLLTITNFTATYLAAGGPSTCTVAGSRDAAIYALAGNVRGSAVSGCLAFAGRSLVGAQLQVAQLEVGELLSVSNFAATYLSGSTYSVPVEGGRPEVLVRSRSTFDLSGSIAARGGAPTNFDGSMVLADGGVERLDLTADRIPISSTVALEDVEVRWEGDGRFDTRPERTLSVSGSAVHDGGTTVLSGELEFAPGGQLDRAELEIGDLPLGPVVLEDFAFRYERARSTTSWLMAAEVSAPDDRSVIADVTGQATFRDGALFSASLDVPRLSVGEVVTVTNLQLGFTRLANGSEQWNGSGGVAGPGQVGNPATASALFRFAPDGSLSAATITASAVRWGGLLTLQDLRFTFERVGRDVQWAVDGQLRVGSGPNTLISGSLVLVDGRAISGSLTLRGLSIAELARIETLQLVASDRGGSTSWEAIASVSAGGGAPVSTTGSIAFERGVLTEASLRLGNVSLGEFARLDDLRIDYVSGRQWSAAASLTDEDGTSTFGGSLEFDDGRVTSGSFDASNVQLGPLELSTLSLTAGPADVPGASVCGLADTAGPGIRYSVSATVRTRDGDTTSLAGRLRLDEGAITEGVLCGSNIKIADLVVLDSVSLLYSSTVGPQGRTVTFAGGAVAENPAGGTSAASISFSLRDRQLRELSVEVEGIEVGELLKLEDLSFSYDRDDSATSWAFDATVAQDGADATLAGDLIVQDGTITGGSLTASEVRFGDLFVLEELELSYFGREVLSGGTGSVSAGANSSCSATPNDSNVPTGFPRGNGSFSQFTAAATVRANGDTYAARGELLFGDGDLAGFDITLACLPLGDFKTLEAVRIAKRPGELAFSGRLQDPDGTSSATGSFVFDDGRLTGGLVRLREVPIGPIQLNRLDVVIGQTATGTTEYGLTVVLTAGESSPVGGGGSLIMDDGRVVGGSLNLSGTKVFDLFRLDEFELTIDGSVAGRTEFDAGVGVSFPPAGGSGGQGSHIGQGAAGDDAAVEVAASFTMVDGRVTAGSFTLGAIKLFDAVPLGRVSAEFDSELQRWAASLEMQLGQNGPSFVLGVELERGKLLSGTVGFDIDGDGQPDGTPGQAPPAGGNAQMSWFPLKAAYLVYCSSEATASYCPGNGVSQWAGRLAIELPTDGAPGFDVSVDIRDGILVEARATLDFSPTGIMVYPPVWLNRIGFAFGLRPFLLGGEIGLSLGTGIVDIAEVVGWVEAGEGPPLGPGESPQDYEADYIFFASGGTVDLFNLPVGGSFVSIFQSNGYLGFGGTVGIDVAGDSLTIQGGIEGAIFNASGAGFNLTNPQTGQPLTGWHAQAHGFVEATILGFNVASADAYISDIGATAFAQMPLLGCTGVGIYWSGGGVRETCDYTRYIVEGVNPTDSPLIPNAAAQTSSAARSRLGTTSATEVEFSEFDVAPGEEVLGVTVSGFGSALEPDDPTPDVALMAPDGTVYGANGVDDPDPNDGILINSAPNNRFFFIADPQPGTWRVESAPGSVPIKEVAASRKLPPAEVSGTVTQAGRQAIIDYEVTPLPGQEVLLYERSVGETDVFESGIGTATGRSGQIRFTPAGDARPGTREVMAVVMQEGFRRTEISLGTFQVGTGQPAGAPQQVRAIEIPGGARVTWQPPADDGGRKITSYRVFSDLGFDVTVDAQDIGVDMPIPAMEPGEEVPVYVEARTGMGWGFSGATSFTSTQTTPWQYQQYRVPRETWVDGPTELPDLPVDPVDPVDPPDPTDPTDPTDPGGPGAPGGPGSEGTGPTTPVGTLARTGSELLVTWWWGVLLVASGAAFVWLGRRRRDDAPPPVG